MPIMDYLVRFAQTHETFRLPEIHACATLAGVDIEILSYYEFSPYCVVRAPNEEAMRTIAKRSILIRDVFELWGQGTNYEELHADVPQRSQHRWKDFEHSEFAFRLEYFGGKCNSSSTSKREILTSFTYTGFKGPVNLKNAEQQFFVMEEYIDDVEQSVLKVAPVEKPRKIFLGRKICDSCRDTVLKYDLKKRDYISTTSMDAELSLVTANMALAGPGKLFFDPFVGTGSFIVCASHFGALSMGADIDGRSFRGKEAAKLGVYENYKQYEMPSKFVDCFTSDLTNTPLRRPQFLDGIVCDPPYGIREGLRVLGNRHGKPAVNVIIDGVPAHLRPGYVPPKKPYGFEALQKDILNFAVRSLVTNGRLAMWMPTTNDEAVEFPVPMHEDLEVVSVSVQSFNNWSRRLITYRRLPEGEKSDVTLGRTKTDDQGHRADDLNLFRRTFMNRGHVLKAEKDNETTP
ncbi:hypothetical protein N7508_007888 [Penicillium antarcticum]|nr:uncharacterized protein N7508_007888 [Penicillium antarcticum]KAJ5297639.1 hypothetical protein N7508_007888 [Penicillium antarcticum]